tara:strand:+ start:48889 stop:49257 length:369 start_codon:yes stop_codon:yes gene_type:complete
MDKSKFIKEVDDLIESVIKSSEGTQDHKDYLKSTSSRRLSNVDNAGFIFKLLKDALSQQVVFDGERASDVKYQNMIFSAINNITEYGKQTIINTQDNPHSYNLNVIEIMLVALLNTIKYTKK